MVMDSKSERERERERETRIGIGGLSLRLRVLLVESDDSTRLLISALLRKCSYIVVAVSDGLKAWETLKARPQNIDLILTEVDLPSISGYALLTLIMEHHICKRIPVIMTSSQDSISLVLRCTLRGAADFLVKPIRRNELRNLWHHVWRRQTKTEVPAVVQNTMDAQHKVDPFCDEKPGNDLSSYNVNGGDRSKEERLQLIRKSVLPTPKPSGSGSEVISREETNKSTVSSLGEDPTSARSLTLDANECPPRDLAHDNISGDTYRCTHGLVVPSAAIDYISKFEDYSGNVSGCSGAEGGVDELSFAPHLELSLRRPCPNGTEDERTVEQRRLNHSNDSAFSRYDNGKTLQSLSPAMGSNYEHGTVLTGSREDPMTRDGKIDVLNWDAIWHNHIPPELHTGSGLSPIFSPTSDVLCDLPLNTNSEHNVEENENISASANGVRDASFVLEPSSTSSSCSGAVSKLKSSTCGSLCSTVDNSTSGPFVTVTKSSGSKGLNNNYTLVQEGMTDMDSHCPSQREAALQKFRLKRKDRCFDKKVRYQSRKRLAEQRPRVKGQFVRQVKAESSLADGCEYPSRLTNFDF